MASTNFSLNSVVPIRMATGTGPGPLKQDDMLIDWGEVYKRAVETTSGLFIDWGEVYKPAVETTSGLSESIEERNERIWQAIKQAAGG